MVFTPQTTEEIEMVAIQKRRTRIPRKRVRFPRPERRVAKARVGLHRCILREAEPGRVPKRPRWVLEASEIAPKREALNQGSPTFLKLWATSWYSIMRRATSLMHTSETKILLNLPSLILVLIFLNVKTLIMLMLFLERARGRPTWSLRVNWCPRAPRWWPLLQSIWASRWGWFANTPFSRWA